MSFWRPVGGAGAPLGVYGRHRGSNANRNLKFSKSGATLCRQGTPKRAPETQRIAQEWPKGCQKGPKTNPKVKQIRFLETLILDDPTMF